MNACRFLLAFLCVVNLQLIIHFKAFTHAGKWAGKIFESRRDSRDYFGKKLTSRARFYLQLTAVQKEDREKITLHCKLRGKKRPLAKFSWEKDGLPLMASSRLFIKTRQRGERLKIKNVRQIDAGKYRCLAMVNGKKIRSKSVKIFIPGTINQRNSFEERSQPLLKERCEEYRGSICNAHMNSARAVFMRPDDDQDEVEKRLADNMKHLKRMTSPECYPAAFRAACISIFPPCRKTNGSAEPMLLCKESCVRFSMYQCTKEFQLLRDLKITRGSCDRFPAIDANKLCARVFRPGSFPNNRKCKNCYRLREHTLLDNRLTDALDESSICRNVKWRPMSKETRRTVQLILRSDKFSGNGLFGTTSNGALCLDVPVRISTLVRSRIEFSKIFPLPGLKIPHEKIVRGFSMVVDWKGDVKRLEVPVGFVKEYGIDKAVRVSSVTLYMYKEGQKAMFFGQGVFSLCGTMFKIRIEQVGPDETILTGYSPHPVNLSTVELAFGLRQPTKEVRKLMKMFKVMELSLINPKMSIYWKDSQQRTMRFSGHAYNSAWVNGRVDVEMIFGKDQSFWVTSVTAAKQSFKEMLGMLDGMEDNALAKLLDEILDVDKVGFILATKDVEIPDHPSLNFQNEPARTMGRLSIAHGFTLEAHANVKEKCKGNDNRSIVCQLLQFAAGVKASTKVQFKSQLNGFLLSIEFHPDGIFPRFSSKTIMKLQQAWEMINPFKRVPSTNVEIMENDDDSWKFMPRYPGMVWLRGLQAQVNMDKSTSLFDHNLVYISADVIYLNKRYTYKINGVGRKYSLDMLDSISEILKERSSK